MSEREGGTTRDSLPPWLPKAARHYIAHRESGVSIRQLAREQGCHASTVLRRIRRFETRCADPLVDRALGRLAPGCTGSGRRLLPMEQFEMKVMMSKEFRDPGAMTLSERALERQALPVLRLLAAPGTVLAVAEDMEKAVLVRDRPDGAAERLDIIDRNLAEALALKGWIECKTPARLSRYRITNDGRVALNSLIAKCENSARGFAEGMTHFAPRDAVEVDVEEEEGSLRGRGFQADTPVAALARRRDRDGQRFLRPEHVRAGERLREDFELAQMGPRTTQDWNRFLTAGVSPQPGNSGARGPEGARDRVALALRDLGPGLGDVALRCCCHLEGLETAERKMGWSARSGKIVLRIALERLARHYAAQPDDTGLIG